MKKILLLCGGVGGAKLALGFSRLLKPDELTIVVNTADDFEHLGFPISPDIDTVIYTLAGINDKKQGWGIENESWSFMETLDQKDKWFQLGDKDIRTHKLRKQLLASGNTLSAATQSLCNHYGVDHSVIPMSDDGVSTVVKTLVKDIEADLPFQHYFVRERCAPAVSGFYFQGIETAEPSPGFVQALNDPALQAVVICPSNPFVSIDPILSIPGVREQLCSLNKPVLAVSPIIKGQAIKGPTAKMMEELDIPRNSTAIANHYHELITDLIIDEADKQEAQAIETLGMHCHSTQTLMKNDQDKIHLAQFILDLL